MDSNYDVFMAKNGKYNKHTSHIASRINFVSNGEKRKMHKIDWFEGGLQLADICYQECWWGWFNSKDEIYYGKTWQLIQNTCTRGVT